MGSPGRVPPIPQAHLGSGSIPQFDDLGDPSIKSQSPLASTDTNISIIPEVKQVATSFVTMFMSSYNFQGPTTNLQHISNFSDDAIRNFYHYLVRTGPSVGIYPPLVAAETGVVGIAETGGVGIAETGGVGISETGGVGIAETGEVAAVDGNGEEETGGEETEIEDYSSPSKKFKI